MRNIIIDGIDCSGKSTLASKIKFKLKKYGGYDIKSLEHIECSSQFERYLYEYSINKRVIFDRCHISEVVFGKILRNDIPFSEEELIILNKIIKLNFIIILAMPSFQDFSVRMEQTKNNQVICIKDYDNITTGFLNATKQLSPLIYESKSNEELENFSNKIISLLINSKQ